MVRVERDEEDGGSLVEEIVEFQPGRGKEEKGSVLVPGRDCLPVVAAASTAMWERA